MPNIVVVGEANVSHVVDMQRQQHARNSEFVASRLVLCDSYAVSPAITSNYHSQLTFVHFDRLS